MTHKTSFKGMTLLRRFQYVDPKDGTLRSVEVRRCPHTGLTLRKTETLKA